MKAEACKAFSLDESEVQCWDYHQCSIIGDKALDADSTSLGATVQGCNILDNQDILLIEKVYKHADTATYVAIGQLVHDGPHEDLKNPLALTRKCKSQ